MTERTSILLLIVSLSICTLHGCAANQPLPKDYFYRLPLPDESASSDILAGGVVFIDRFEAGSIYANRAIVYAHEKNPLVLQRYHYHFWEDAPDTLVREQLFALIKKTNRFQNSGVRSSYENYDYKVGGKIYAFDHIRGVHEGSVRIRLELWLLVNADQTFLVNKIYEVEHAVASALVHDAVDVFGLVLAEIFENFLLEANKRITKL